MHGQGPHRRQQGIALLIVLWLVALLGTIAGSYLYMVRTETGVVGNLLAVAQARAAAEAGVHLAAFRLLSAEREHRWRTDGSVYRVPFADAQLRIALSQEAGRIDLNGARPALLDGMLASAGVGEDRRAAVVDAIVDWRDPDELGRLHGAERTAYEAAGRSYGPRNGPFQGAEELALVLGITPEVYRRLAPIVTVYTGAAGLDPSVATRPALLAQPGMDPARVDAFLAQRSVAATSALPDGPLRIQVEAEARGARLQLAAVVRLTAVPKPGQDPVTVLAWLPDAAFPNPDRPGGDE
jgi:general secretion pathway protein K